MAIKNDCMVKLIESQAQDLGQYSFNQIIAIQARLSVQQLYLLKSQKKYLNELKPLNDFI